METKVPATIPYMLYEQVRQMIIDGTLAPGQPLREQELERRFGTSRSPIREALRLLELSGLATHAQRRGFRVVLYSEREIRQLYLLRAELEAYAIQGLAGHKDLQPLLGRLRDAHERLVRCEPGRAVLSYLSTVRGAFLEVVDFVGNQPLREAVHRLNERCEPLRYNLFRRGFSDVGASACFVGRVADAITQRDFDLAAAIRRECAHWILPMVLRAYAEEVGARAIGAG
ncbi:GntR family transcriptional regulator [Bordetella sp. H567]|uniref:GntR family transcriptional regulator n=1 Tax=Bordetella sp. H567 TaxID=1697043 RepID=UPI00082A6F85|nr:GntR family transcriptional regulator [Bordetella sp. H567]